MIGLLVPACLWTALHLRRPRPETPVWGAPPETLTVASATAGAQRSLSRESGSILTAAKAPSEKPWRDPAEALALLPRLEQIPLEEIQAACESLLPLELGFDSNALKLLVERWITLAPADAFRWVVAQTAKEARDPNALGSRWVPVLHACGRMWAAQDCPGFLLWWQSTGSRLPEGAAPFSGCTLRDEITCCMAGWLAQEWPAEALRYFASTPDIRGKDDAGRIISLGIAAGNLIHSPEEARGALLLMEKCRETNEESRNVSAEVMMKWAALDDRDLEKWLSDHPDNIFSANGRNILANHRLQHSPDRAAAANAWLAERGRARVSGTMDIVVAMWPAEDLDSAGRWLDAQPRTPQRWRAVERFAERVLQDDPEAAFAWLASIEAPAPRRARIARVFDKWEQSRPDQAAAFLKEHPFDEAQMQWIEERRAVR